MNWTCSLILTSKAKNKQNYGLNIAGILCYNMYGKELIFMPTIRPIADLRDTGKISELCYQKNEPVFITKNGSGHLVVMSMDTYDQQMGLLDIYRKLGAAEKQVAEGVPLLSGDEVFTRLREKRERGK